MRCGAVRRQLSAYRDGDLDGKRASLLRNHLETCDACAAHWESLGAALGELRAAPLLRPSESIAAAVGLRLDMETRCPGLALLFRPAWAVRPLMLPSLLPAALVLASVLGGALFLDRTFSQEALPEVFVPSADVSVPRVRRAGSLPAEALTALGEESLFFETIVSGDGTVFSVTLIDGDRDRAQPLLEALRRERFEPGRLRGFLPVTVSVYHLISLTEVWAPAT